MARIKRLVIRKHGDSYQVVTQLAAARGRYRIGNAVLVPQAQLKSFLREDGLAQRLGLER